MKKYIFLILIFFICENVVFSSYQTNDNDYNLLLSRKMFYLKNSYKYDNQILLIQALSSVFQYADRHFLVVKLVDQSQIPFYKSTGHNSGLPESWLPFFGVRNDGWLNKNYTFNSEYKTHIPSNPLYHCGYYALAQVANELDRMPMRNPIKTFGNDPNSISKINCWIGGQMLDVRPKYKMPQDIDKYEKETLIQSPPITRDALLGYEVVDIKATKNENLFKSFRDMASQDNFIACGNSFENLIDEHLFEKTSILNEIKTAPRFIFHDIQILIQRMAKFNFQDDANYYRGDYISFRSLIQEAQAFYHSPSQDYKVQFKKYLALQMLKRFSVNFVYKMLNDVNRGKLPFTLTDLVSSRALWTIIKKEFNNKERRNNLKKILLEIRKNNPDSFLILAAEKPKKINEFLDLDTECFDPEATEIEKDINAENFLNNFRKKVFEFYENDRQIINSTIERIITKSYHKKTFNEIIDHYTDENHHLGKAIKGINDNGSLEFLKREILLASDILELNKEEEVLKKIQNIEFKLHAMIDFPKKISALKIIDLSNNKNYYVAINNIQLLKEYSKFCIEKDTLEKIQISLNCITAVLYLKALEGIKVFSSVNIQINR